MRRGAVFTLAGGLGMAGLGLAGVHELAWVLLAHWLFSFGHGIHQPCGQSGSVGPFPDAAGAASALSGLMMMLVAFAMGSWLGWRLDGTVFPLTNGIGFWTAAIVAVAWVLVSQALVGQPWYQRVVVHGGSIALALVAAYWFWERVS